MIIVRSGKEIARLISQIIDTNIVLDILYNRKPFVIDSLNVFRLCETKKIEGYISTLFIANIIYILRKELNNNKIKEILEKLSHILKIVDLIENDLKKACTFEYKDYEDAVQTVQADRVKSQYIISRNQTDFINKHLKVISPREFIESIYVLNEI